MAVIGQTVGYVRVSSVGQNPARQYEALGQCDRTFEDRLSGKDTDRPALTEMVSYVREGDTVKVASMDRLARSLSDLLDLVKSLTSKGVEIVFLKEGLTFKPGSADAYAEFQMHVLAAVAQFERSIIKGRQREGIELAKARGVYKGRKPALTREQIEQATARVEQGVSKSRIARDLGVSRATLYTALAGGGTYGSSTSRGLVGGAASNPLPKV